MPLDAIAALNSSSYPSCPSFNFRANGHSSTIVFRTLRIKLLVCSISSNQNCFAYLGTCQSGGYYCILRRRGSVLLEKVGAVSEKGYSPRQKVRQHVRYKVQINRRFKNLLVLHERVHFSKRERRGRLLTIVRFGDSAAELSY